MISLFSKIKKNISSEIHSYKKRESLLVSVGAYLVRPMAKPKTSPSINANKSETNQYRKVTLSPPAFITISFKNELLYVACWRTILK